MIIDLTLQKVLTFILKKYEPHIIVFFSNSIVFVILPGDRPRYFSQI